MALHKKYGWIGLLMTLAGLATLTVQVGYACSPAPNGFVFADSIEMDTATLPPGVNFNQESLYQLTFSNNSDDTVYVLADPTLLRDTWPAVDVPQDLVQLVPDDRIIAIALAPADSFDLRRSDAFFPGYNPDAYFDYDSPELFEGLPVPDPIDSQIVMIAGGEAYEVDVAISYAPNPEYDPEGFAKGVEACAEFNETSERTAQVAGIAAALPVIGIAICGLLVAVAGGAGLVIFLMRRRT